MVGEVISLTHRVGSVARIMTRAMYATIIFQKLSLNSEVELMKEACDELAFWDLCHRLPSLSILTHPITPAVPSLIKTTKFSIKIGVRQKVLKAQLGGNSGP